MGDRAAGPILSRRVLVFLVGIAFAEASMSMPMVQVPVYLRELGADISQIGIFFTISSVFPLIFRVYGGWLADAVGRLKVISIGSFAGVLTFAVYALAPSWQAALLAPALLAVTTALTIPAYYAFIADQSSETVRGRTIGISQTIRRASWVIAPPLGGLLAQSHGYRWMFVVSSLTFAVAAVIFLLLRRSSAGTAGLQRQPGMASIRASLGEMLGLFLAGGVVTWLLIVDGVRDIAFKLSFDLMPVYLSDIAGISKEGIGFLDGIFALAVLAAFIPGGLLADKTSERVGVVLGLVVMVASRLVFAVAEGYWGFALSWILLGIGGGFIEPAGVSLVTKSVPRHLRGITFGLFATSLSLFSLPSPWLGSQVWNQLGPRYPFLLTGIIGCLTVLPAWYKLKTPKRQEPPITRPEAATLPTIGEGGEATLLLAYLRSDSPGERAELTAEQAQELLSSRTEIIAQHGGMVARLEGDTLLACFGLSPNRAPPQVSALLATHAALSLQDDLQADNELRTAVGLEPLWLGIGIATGEVSIKPLAERYPRLPGGTHGGGFRLLGKPFEIAQRLQGLTGSLPAGGVLISEDTYRYLAVAHHQFIFGRSGPILQDAGTGSQLAYEVQGRTQPMKPARQSGSATGPFGGELRG